MLRKQTAKTWHKCTGLHTHKHTDAQTHTDRQTDTHTTHTHTDTHVHTQHKHTHNTHVHNTHTLQKGSIVIMLFTCTIILLNVNSTDPQFQHSVCSLWPQPLSSQTAVAGRSSTTPPPHPQWDSAHISHPVIACIKSTKQSKPKSMVWIGKQLRKVQQH